MAAAALVLSGTTIFTASCARNSYEASLNQLPDNVEAVARNEIRGGRVKDVEVETEDGLRFYEIEYEYNDQEYELLLDQYANVIHKKPD
jgi:uncharacterized membrane protein YkoI